MHKIDNFNKLFLTTIQRYTYTFNAKDNNCPNIKIGDNIEIDNINGEVEALEWAMKSFGIKGENVTALLNQKKSIDERMPFQNEVFDFFLNSFDEIHYLNSKPVEDWDEYDLSNWLARTNRFRKKND